jgi:hypothetical protein
MKYYVRRQRRDEHEVAIHNAYGYKRREMAVAAALRHARRWMLRMVVRDELGALVAIVDGRHEP